ncbi:MAG TPA: YfhO family protein [Thermomicrobiales bacterium]|nr:YfhO family protein [Thermomicrobiales bacterium]
MAEPVESSQISRRWWQPDSFAALAIVVVTAFAAGQLFNGGTLIGQDSATQFYPWYDYLGERLRAGEIPGWNPYQFGGAPFAADPQSGWTYLPAMLLFTVFPLPLAVPAFLLLHLTIAGFATYVLARLLRLGVGGALVAAVAYELSGPVLGRSVCCPAALEVATWAPVALVGAELAIRSNTWTRRIAGWSIAGLALSQGLAAWLGQGVYYLLLALGAFIAFRTLFSPADPDRTWSGRLQDAALHGSAVLAIGFGLAAAGILPRLEYVSRSNVAGGEYSGQSAWAAEIGGVTPNMVFERFFDPSLHYPGTAVAILALAALWLARGWLGTRFFAAFGIGALILAAPWTTPLHALLYAVLPRFEELHKHWPERVAVVGYLAIALLAGAGVDRLRRGEISRGQIVTIVGLPVASVAALMLVREGGVPVAIALVIVALSLLVVPKVLGERAVRWAVPVLLCAVIAFDLLVGFQGIASQAPYGGFHRVNLDEYYERTGAVAFIEQQGAEEPGRYVGFDQSQRAIADGQRVLYRFQFASPETVELLVNNRGTLHGLEDAQGYNPVQPRRFVEFLTALNGHPQEYHDANIYPEGFNSPLLDLLNIRYVVIPAEIPDDRNDLLRLSQQLPTIYIDDEVRVLENRQAVPQAWIVHEASQVARGEALPLLADGKVDPLRTALLETTPPELAPATDPAADQVTMTTESPDRLELTTSSDAPGLLMLSESYDPGWHAYVDGSPVDVLVADHLLRAVPLPAGEHVVELRYEPRSLQIGVAISTVTALVVIFALAISGWRTWRRDVGTVG